MRVLEMRVLEAHVVEVVFSSQDFVRALVLKKIMKN